MRATHTRIRNLGVALLMALFIGGCAAARLPVAPPTMPVLHAAGNATLQGDATYGVLIGLLAIAAGVFVMVSTPFKRFGWGAVAAGAALIAACLTLHAILPYVGWIVFGGAVIAAGVLFINIRRLMHAAAVAWHHVDDGVIVPSAAESLLNKLPTPKGLPILGPVARIVAASSSPTFTIATKP